MSSRRRRLLAPIVAAVTLTGSAFYLLSALVLAGPKTPITFSLYPMVASYMHPVFPQNWNLFAPDPVNEERGLLARARCATGSTTEWTNVTARGIEKVQGTRLFPSRESRIISNGMIVRFQEDSILQRAEREDAGGRPAVADEVLEPLREAVDADQKAVERVMARFALMAVATNCADEQVSDIQLRYVFHKFPGWSSRHDLEAIGDISTLDSEWITP